jgi:hypothetical protein
MGDILEAASQIRGRFVEQNLMPSSTFRCDQNHNFSEILFGPHFFVVLLKLDLNVQQTHLEIIQAFLSRVC